MATKKLLEQFYARQKKLTLANSLRNVAANDQNNRMPPRAADTRSAHLSHISWHISDLSNEQEYLDIVDTLYSDVDSLDGKDKRSVQLATWGLNFQRKYTAEFSKKREQIKSTALLHRHQAKAANDRSILAPHLAESISYATQYAKKYDTNINSFDVMLDGWHPGMNRARYDTIFAHLLEVSQDIISKEKNKEQKNMDLFVIGYDLDQLRHLLEELLRAIWFDFQQWNLGLIKRPYSENCGPYDERIHIWSDKPLIESILACMHECGHGLTDMFINSDYHWTNIHRTTPMGMHEAMARTLENFVGRSRGFCVYLSTLLRKYFPQINTRDPDELYLYLNDIQPSLTRVTADEVTYNIHIYIRYLIEGEVFSWDLHVDDVSARRSALYTRHLGIAPTDDREGALQDQHRGLGLFGYFPTYTLGNIIAGQLWQQFIVDQPDRETKVEKGDFSDYFLRYHDHIRQHGNLQSTNQTLIDITWSDIDPTWFAKYLTDKYT